MPLPYENLFAVDTYIFMSLLATPGTSTDLGTASQAKASKSTESASQSLLEEPR